MSQAIQCFRTVTRCGIFRQSISNGSTILTPVAIASPPKTIAINPGDSIEEPKEMALDGREVPAFTYVKGQAPEVELNFDMTTLDLEAIIHGRNPKAITSGSVEGWIYAEFVASSATPYPARMEGQLGYGVAAQDADSRALFFYIDPATKLAKKMTVAAAANSVDTIDEIFIDQHLAVTVSSAMATAKYQIYGWVPYSFTAGTVLSATPTGLFTIVGQGISFDNKARLFQARNCSRLSGSVGGDTARQLKFRVNPDANDGTGLGYQIIDTALNVV